MKHPTHDQIDHVIHHLGLVDYQTCYQAMQDFTATRQADTPDEIWLLEHAPVYTLGQAGLTHHMHTPNNIPVVNIDRGGQVTYHGPGQLVVYLLLDLRRLGIYVKDLVWRLEEAIIKTLAEYSIYAYRQDGAPGVYIQHNGQHSKIAALGLKIKKSCTYHGLALNVAMDKTPFDAIHPCGYAGLPVVDVHQVLHGALHADVLNLDIPQKLTAHLLACLYFHQMYK